ncbi:MAG: four helix bundle protein [Spiribacter salinus]|uniref:Four helix bundle protein n=1 Tax=Spiribacter salinus TaxID=1335746 RepID=A0A540VP89_9GAMM|nr:MAG: four helix bundle protein [Spiribacter salinus]
MRFEQLDVWKRAARLLANLYRALANSREYAFKDQITRSARSIASNIAEGYKRKGAKDRAKLLNYAKGSCGELRSQLYISIEAGFIPKEQGAEWIRETKELSKMLHGLTKTLGKPDNP